MNNVVTPPAAKELLIAAAKSGSIELWQAVASKVSKRRPRSSCFTNVLYDLLCVAGNRRQMIHNRVNQVPPILRMRILEKAAPVSHFCELPPFSL